MTPVEFLTARIAEDEEWGERYGCDDEHDGLDLSPRCKARVLAECDAKRRIIESCVDDGWPDGDSLAARLLAEPYADHPDYRQEWRP